MVQDGLDGLVEQFQTEAFHQLADAPLTGAAGGNLGVQVANNAVRHAGIETQQVFDFLVEHAGLVELQAGHEQAFLEDIRGIEDVAGVLLPEIEPVLLDGRIAHQFTAGEDGRDGQHVQRMRRGPVGIAGQQQVAGLQVLFADELDSLHQAVVIPAREDGQAGRLRQHSAFPVINTEAEIAQFVDHRAVRGAHEVAFHLARGGEQVVVDDLYCDGIKP